MSEKTVLQKILVREGYRVLFVNPPPGYLASAGELPAGVTVLEQAQAPVDLIQVFLTSYQEMEEKLGVLKAALAPKGLLWVTYPKGTSKMKTDVNRDIIAAYARSMGMVGIAMVAVDDTWAALRLKFAE
jgi:predicted CoA-binding protein